MAQVCLRHSTRAPQGLPVPREWVDWYNLQRIFRACPAEAGLVGSIFVNNFTTVQDLQLSPELWDLSAGWSIQC